MAPIVIKPLPKGWTTMRDAHASSFAMANWRHAGIPPFPEKGKQNWTTSVGYTATQRSALQLPSPPAALLEEAKQQAKLKQAGDQVTPEQKEGALKSQGFPTLYEEGAACPLRRRNPRGL